MAVEKSYKLRDVADILGVKVRTVRQWVHDGRIEATKVAGGKHWFVKESEIRRVQDGNKD